MKRILLVLFVLSAVLGLQASLNAQGTAEVTMTSNRLQFKADGDNNRNLVELISDASLEYTMLMTSDFRFMTELYLDSIQDAPKMQLTVDVPSFTTGFPELDSRVLSKDFINFGENKDIQFNLLNLTPGRVFKLENEKRIEAAGHGELMMGEKVDTVSIEMGIRYLEGNNITKLRMPGSIVHMDGTIYFRLSDFGIEVPKENRLMVNDQVQLKFNIFASTEYELPMQPLGSTPDTTEDMASGESTGGQ